MSEQTIQFGTVVTTPTGLVGRVVGGGISRSDVLYSTVALTSEKAPAGITFGTWLDSELSARSVGVEKGNKT